LTPQALAILHTSDLETIPDPDQAAILQEAVTALTAGLQTTTARHIATMMARLANIYRAEKLTAAEAEGRLETYTALLEDIPPDILVKAFKTAGQTLKFFPAVAEIREIAEPEFKRRRWAYSRAQWLIRRHEEKWRAPQVIPEEERAWVAQEMAKLTRKIRKRFPSTRPDPLQGEPAGPMKKRDSKVEVTDGRSKGGGAGGRADDTDSINRER
jgi:hypothetical protein